MSMYDNIMAAMDNTIPSAAAPNRALYDTSSVQNESVKSYIEAKGSVASASDEIDKLRAKSQVYFKNAEDADKNTALTNELNEARTRANESSQKIDWNSVSKEDYEAALNASCGVNNKQGGLDEKIQNQALFKLTIDSMSKEEIVDSFTAFMNEKEQEKWLTGIANDEKYKQYIPDEATLNAYVEETKSAILDKEPRPDPNDDFALKSTVMDTLNEVHENHSREVVEAKESSKFTPQMTKDESTQEVLNSKQNNAPTTSVETAETSKQTSETSTETKKGPLSRLKARFASVSNSTNTDTPSHNDDYSKD